MAALTSTLFVLLFTFSRIFAQSEDTKKITVKPGDPVTLSCQGPLADAIKVLMWKRSDLESEEYVFYFRDNSSLESFQLERYRGRVELRDPEMKNGNASVILRNVTDNDTGTYECFVPNSNGGRRRRATDIRQTINLEVTESDAGHAGDAGDSGDGGRGHGGLVAAAVICVSGAVCLVVLFVRKTLKKKSESPAADGADVQISLNS